MTRDEFIEQFPSVESKYKFNADTVKNFILDAFDAHAEIKDMTHIIVPIPEFQNANPKYYGLYISIYDQILAVWIAVDDGSGVRDGMNIGDYPLDNLQYRQLVSKCINDANVCPTCKRVVGIENMHQFSFAGRCCEKCLPGMKKTYETPGWYN